MKRFSTVAPFLLWAVAACAPAMPISPQQVSAIKTIGIISAIGNQVEIKNVVALRPMEVYWRLPGNGQVDDLVVKRLGDLLAPRFEIRPVTYARAKFFDAWRGPALNELVRTEVTPQGLDAYVVVTPTVRMLGVSGVLLTGIGLLETGSGIFGYEDQLYTLYKITVIDGRQLAILGSQGATLGNDSIVIAGPHRDVDHALWAESAAEMSDAHRAQLDTEIKDLVDRSLPLTLHALGLVN